MTHWCPKSTKIEAWKRAPQIDVQLKSWKKLEIELCSWVQASLRIIEIKQHASKLASTQLSSSKSEIIFNSRVRYQLVDRSLTAFKVSTLLLCWCQRVKFFIILIHSHEFFSKGNPSSGSRKELKASLITYFGTNITFESFALKETVLSLNSASNRFARQLLCNKEKVLPSLHAR